MNAGEMIIVIPSLNPSEQLAHLTEALIQSGYSNIIVVDDGSDPLNYRSIFEGLNERKEVVLLTHAVNQGKGRALKTAFNYILSHAQKYSQIAGIITVDGDGQHKVDDIDKCVLAFEKESSLKTSENSIVLGCRCFDQDAHIPFRSRLGNKCTKIILRYLCNINISDSQTGLRVFPLNLLPRLMAISGERYEYETNMLLELAEENTKMVEVPISTIYENNNAASHFNPIRDSARIYGVILKYSMASMLSACLDYLVFAVLALCCSNVWILTFVGRAVSAMVNFTLNKRLVFQASGRVWPQIIKYLCLLLASGSISAFLVSTIHSAVPVNIVLIKLVVESVLYFFNFYVQRNFVFADVKMKE